MGGKVMKRMQTTEERSRTDEGMRRPRSHREPGIMAAPQPADVNPVLSMAWLVGQGRQPEEHR